MPTCTAPVKMTQLPLGTLPLVQTVVGVVRVALTVLVELVPSPIWPLRWSPQCLICWLSSTAQVLYGPAASCLTPVRPGTAVGFGCAMPSTTPPRPSAPSLLLPQQSTLVFPDTGSVMMAHACASPA